MPEPDPGIPHSGKRAYGYWLCQISGWGLLFLVNWNFSRQSEVKDLTAFTLIWGWSSILGMALSHLWRHYLCHILGIGQSSKIPLFRLTAGITLLGTVQTLLIVAAFFILRPALFSGSWSSALNYLPVWMTVFLIWTTIYVAVHSVRRARRFELEKLQLEVNVKDAELRALQAQINPHFFFNSLNSLRGLIFEDQIAAASMVDKLAGMMRYSLRAGQQDTVRLAQELEAVRIYLAIEKIRFEERLLFTEEIQPSVDDCAVPAMLLQTLIENAIKYGVEPSIQPCQIRLTVQRMTTIKSDSIRIVVANHGKLMLPGKSTQLGLKNTEQRLKLIFGDAASIALTEQTGQITDDSITPENWVHATLTLPYQLLKATA